MPSTIKLFERHNNNLVFVETGTLEGESVKSALFAGYKEIYSVELAEKYYLYSKDLFKYQDNIHIIYGDSVKVLAQILPKIESSITFWLDAHYSGGDTTFADVLYPVMKELELIKLHHVKTHTIIIDDLRLLKPEFPSVGFGIEDLKAKIREINPEYNFYITSGHVDNDILVAEIKSQKSFNIIVFSKDRACQLELFIRSFNKYVRDGSSYTINVLYTYSNKTYKKGYDKLIKNSPSNVKFKLENSFKDDVLSMFGDGLYTVFFTDDDVFKNPVDFYDGQMQLFNEDTLILCRSLRLNKDLTFCYPSRESMTMPNVDENNIYEWYGQLGDYGYPLSLDGHIFRSHEIYAFVKNSVYVNPNTMEGSWQKQFTDRTKMVFYDESPLMNLPLNRVQTVNHNICGNVTAEELNTRYLSGEIINLAPLNGMRNISCHQEVDIQFEDEM